MFKKGRLKNVRVFYNQVPEDIAMFVKVPLSQNESLH
jgi:hypothetical protein